MSNASYDIGGITGAESQIWGYVPGKPLRVFIAVDGVGYKDHAIRFVRRWVGEVEFQYQPERCLFCVAIPGPTGQFGERNWADIKTFFDRFGTEARVYEYDHIEQKLWARTKEYFEQPGRVI